MNIKNMILAASMLMPGALMAQNQTDWSKPMTDRFDMHGYAQAGYNYQDQQSGDVSTYKLYRVLFWVNGNITDKWSFRFMHDFSSVPQEFFTSYRVTDGKQLNVRFGQFKHGFSLENQLSPTKQELISVCSQSIAYLTACGGDPLTGVQYGRDLGLEVFGELFDSKLVYTLGLMQGAPINKVDNNTEKDFIAKLDIRPMDGLRLVTSCYLGTGHALAASAFNPGIAVGQDYTRNRYSAGFEYKSSPFNLRAEYLAGKDGSVNSQGWYATALVPVIQDLDVIASYDFFDKNVDMNVDQTNYTFGIQYWYYKNCRLQLQYTNSSCQAERNYNSIQAQVQVAF